MTQIYPNIPSTEAVSDSRQMLLDRDNAVKTDFAGTDYPEVTEDDIGMVCYRTDLKDAFRYIGNDTEGNPIWQREVPADNIRSIKQDIAEETFYIDLPEGEVVDTPTSVWVNIDDRLLNSSEYTITNEGTRITFTEPLQPSSVAEIRWVTRIKVARDGATFVPTLKDGVLSWDNNQNLPNPEDFDFNEAQKNVTAEGDKQVARVEEAGENIVQTAINSQIWAEGTDEQVQALGGIHSSKGWAEANENLNLTDITNCLIKIPNDIKLELNDKTFTAKDGSKIYKPDGTFVILDNDCSQTVTYDADCLCFVNFNNNSLANHATILCYSQEDEPPSSGQVWYKPSTKEIYTKGSSTPWTLANYSLPIAETKARKTSVCSINQLLNGSCYIGNTVFLLPGVEGLIPNGRNDDRSLNNIKFAVSKLLTINFASDFSGYSPVAIDSNNNLQYWDKKTYYQEEEPEAITWSRWWKISENKWYQTGNETVWKQTLNACPFAVCNVSSGRITSFSLKNVFQAVDYNDFIKLKQDVDDTITNKMPTITYLD